MKTINRILTVFMVLSILLCSVATLTAFAANDNQSDSESEIEELQPVMASGCPTYVPGIGWTGSSSWHDAVALVQNGGSIQGWGSNNIYLSEANAKLLISEAGLLYERTDPAHGGSDPHNYPHIHYWANGSVHNTIRIG